MATTRSTNAITSADDIFTLGDRTTWSYDQSTGLLTNKVYADGKGTAYTHTPDGKPLRTIWARGKWRKNAYNADGLLAATTYSDATPAVTLAYDAFQHLAAASNAVADYAYANSALGTATNETATVGGKVHTLTRELDDRQRLASLANDSSAAYYSYDAENRLVAVSNDVFAVAYAYTSDSRDAGYTVTLTNGNVLARSLTRDPYRRSLVRAITNSVNGVAVNPLAYSYDVLNRVADRNADSFGYNARSEVIAACIASNEYGYAYDDIGNHAASSVNAVETTYAANSLNQYTSILRAPAPLREPSYDLDGNLLSDGVFTYSWDAENRLIAVYSNTTCIVSNAHDHASRRVLKATPAAVHTFIYDGWNLIQETIATASSVTTNRYVWGQDLSGTLQGAGGVGGLLAVFLNGEWYFPFYDNNGNITAYVNEQGAVVAEYTYDTFGRTIAQSGPMADAFAFRFSTKYFDAETGLYYYGYRFYSPTLTRWLSRDPANEDEGVNLYAYCGNDSINQYDYIGLSWRIIRRTTEPGGSVYLQGDIAALAEWQSDNSPDFDTLARNIGLNADEVLAWARKDANGTRFSSRAELSKSCNFYIPNRILVITHDAENFTYGLKRYFSRRLNQWGERMADYYTSLRGYAQLHYRYSYPQGGPTNGDRQIDPGHLQWPTAGFVIAAHGKKGLLPEQRIERGASVMYGNGGDEYQLTPLNFMGPRGYKFSFVYVAFCFAGSLSWNDLASQNADFFISPGWRAEAEVFLPSKPNPPRW